MPRENESESRLDAPSDNLEPLPPEVHEAIDRYARYYAEHHKLGMSIRDDMRYIASVAIRFTRSETGAIKPPECAIACPPNQVCDYCQGTGGQDSNDSPSDKHDEQCRALENSIDSNDVRAWRALAYRLEEALTQSATPSAPKDGWWSFLRSVLSQGASIQQDYAAGNHRSYEEYSARLDAAAREREDEINATDRRNDSV